MQYSIRPALELIKYARSSRQNLRNVAVPGTGMPLSFLCYFGSSFFTMLMFLLLPVVDTHSPSSPLVFNTRTHTHTHAHTCHTHHHTTHDTIRHHHNTQRPRQVCMIAAIYEQVRAEGGSGWAGVPASYREHLLHPTDWFSFWR